MYDNLSGNSQVTAMPNAADALAPTPEQINPNPLLAQPPRGQPMPMPHLGLTPDHPIMQGAPGGSRPKSPFGALTGNASQDNAANQEPGTAQAALNPNENQGPDWGE